MKIIQITYTLCSGGAERFVVNLSNELVERGHEVVVCMLRDEKIERYNFNRPLLSPKVIFHSMNFGKGMSLSMMRQTVKFVKKENPDIVHCHLNTLPFIFPLIFRKKIKIVHTIHSLADKDCKGKLQYYLNKKVYSSRRVNAVAISDICKESYVKFYGNNSVRLIFNGSPNAETTDSLSDVENDISRMGRGKVFIHISKYYPLKNQRMLIEAFNKLNEEDVDFSLVVVGNHFDEPDQGLFLKEMACEKIHFVGMKLNVGDYLACADAFCLTSDYEGLPISLLEALSAGVTPICTPVGGIPDVVTDGVTGYLSAGMTVDDYCDAVKRFIASPIDRELLKKYFLDNYSMTKCARQYEQLYNEIVDK
ncbi:MAG: glycosyltransferase family 4 protein [Muribaculaceae bacterium]|nr:glycosyltransferase family 4 protein [Muribaculaceae bacterium]